MNKRQRKKQEKRITKERIMKTIIMELAKEAWLEVAMQKIMYGDGFVLSSESYLKPITLNNEIQTQERTPLR